MAMLKELKKFIVRGNILDMSVGIIVGSAFTKLTNSLVQDVMMPPIGLFLSGIDFSNIFIVIKQGLSEGPYQSLEAARAAGAVVLSIGVFINAVISFLVTALSAFLIITAFNKMQEAFNKKEKEEKAVSERDCPFCLSRIPIKARRCPYCTSDVEGTGTAADPSI